MISTSIILIFCLATLYFFLFTPFGVHTFGETLFGDKEVKVYAFQKIGAVEPQAKQRINAEAEALAINPKDGNIYIGKEHIITILDPTGKYVDKLTEASPGVKVYQR